MWEKSLKYNKITYNLSIYTTLLTSVSFLFNENVRENKTDFGQSWARADLKIWKGKYVHCTRILSGIMKVTKRQSRNNEFHQPEEVDSHGRYAMFIPYIPQLYIWKWVLKENVPVSVSRKPCKIFRTFDQVKSKKGYMMIDPMDISCLIKHYSKE